MTRFDGTAARQLDLIDLDEQPRILADVTRPRRADIRLLKQDVYLELAKRRRRAQLAARHALDKEA